MQTVYFITHPDVDVIPSVPVTEWSLSPRGRCRMDGALALSWARSIRILWSSTERKARDGADILAKSLGLSVNPMAGLGENDRSATGYLPPPEFEAVADTFFARPEQSVRGWERAVDAQSRVVAAVDRLLAASAGCGGDVAVVSHSAVGSLLLCHLQGRMITRAYDQPPSGGGNYFAFDADTRQVHQDWRPIDARRPGGDSCSDKIA